MPAPLALCLEDVDRGTYLRCVALVGRQPGLRLGADGEVVWQNVEAAAELWVSADDRLILYRVAGAGPVVLRRGARALEIPAAKPVVVLGQDEIEIGGRRLVVHTHGPAPRVAPPEPLEVRSPGRAARVAAAAMLGAALAGCPRPAPAEGPKIEVREQPPGAPAPQPDAASHRAAGAAAAATGDFTGAAEEFRLAAALSGAADDILRAADYHISADDPESALAVLHDFLLRPGLPPGDAARVEQKLREIEDIEIRMNPPDMAEPN